MIALVGVAMMLGLLQIILDSVELFFEVLVFLLESSSFFLGVLVVILVSVAPVLRLGELHLGVSKLLALVFEFLNGVFELLFQCIGFVCSCRMVAFMCVAMMLGF